MSRILAALLAMIIMGNCYSQDSPVFRVVFSKGEWQISPSKPYQWQKAGQNEIIKQSYFIRLAPNSEITLVNQNQQAFQLKKAGIYKLGTLKASTEKKSVLGNYIQYLWSSFLHHTPENIEKKRSEYMDVLGGVPRGTLCLLYGPANGYIGSDTIVFHWSNPRQQQQIFAIFSDMDGENLVYKKDLMDSLLMIKASELKGHMGKPLYWKVEDNGEYADCQMRHFILVDAGEASIVISGANALQSSLNFSPGLNALLMAYYYAEKGWSEDALKYYREAYHLEPDNPSVKSSEAYFKEIEIE